MSFPAVVKHSEWPLGFRGSVFNCIKLALPCLCLAYKLLSYFSMHIALLYSSPIFSPQSSTY